MRSMFAIAAFFLLIGTCQASTDVIISKIRHEYKSIREALPTLAVESIELNDYSAEGGVGTAYRDATGHIRFILAKFYGESGKVFDEYYFKGGRLFFVYSERHKYNVPFYVTPEDAKELGVEPFDPKKTGILENRYYFHEMKLIRWIDENRKNVDVTADAFKAAEKEVIKFMKEIMEKFEKTGASVK